MKIHHLVISWSISRGRDTYGYNICRLNSRASGRRYRTCGGGYDMIGTVFGDWLESEFQAELVELSKGLELELYGDGKTGIRVPTRKAGLYGFFVNPNGSVTLDGGCGITSMKQIAEAIGLEVQWEGNKKGHTIGYYVAPAMAEAA